MIRETGCITVLSSIVSQSTTSTASSGRAGTVVIVPITSGVHSNRGGPTPGRIALLRRRVREVLRREGPLVSEGDENVGRLDER
jgi:hypothetical protein